MLIDSRNRLEGELKQLAFLRNRASDLHDFVVAQIKTLEAGGEKLALLKRSASDLHDSVLAKFQELDTGLAQVSDRYEPERVRQVRSMRTTARGQYGQLTRQIFGALKASGGAPLTTTQVFDHVVAHWPADSTKPTEDQRFFIHMRQRLRGLRGRGVVLSPHVGRGGRAETTWMINPLRPEQDEGTLSTLFDDDFPGSTRRTTPKDRPA